MPFVNGYYQPIKDEQIGSAPTPQSAPSDALVGVAQPMGGGGLIDTIAAKERQSGTLGQLNPFRTFGNVYSSIVERAFQSMDNENPNPGFWERSLKDVISLGTILPTMISHPIKTVEELPKGLVESAKNIVTPSYYKEHPVLGAVNTITAISGVAGIIRGGTMKAIVSDATKVAGDEAATQLGLASARTAAQIVSQQYLRTATEMAVRTGDTSIIREVMSNGLVSRGFEQGVADTIASKVVASIEGSLKTNAPKLAVLNGLEHPLKATGEAIRGKAVVDEAVKADLIKQGVTEAVAEELATSRQGGLSKITQSIFGEPAKTAVGRIYGADVVAKNPSGFLDIENWAGQQAVERGLPNTVENRLAVMNDWATAQGDWNLLSPEERVARQQNYIQATEIARKVNAMTGDTTVPTKFLSPSYVEAITQTIKDAPKDQTPQAIFDELKNDYGNDVALHSKTIQAVIDNAPNDRAALIDVIQSLAKRSTLSYHNLPEVNALIKQLEDQTGYRLIEAPQGKPISFAESSVRPAPELPQSTADVGATSFRGTPVAKVEETAAYYETPRAKGFMSFIQAAADKLGIKLESSGKVAGVWEGKIEPSFKASTTGTLDKIYSYAAELGQKGNQDAVVIFVKDGGSGVKYTFANLTDANAAIAKMQELGISGGTIDGASLIIYDLDGSLATQVGQLGDVLGIKPTQINGTVKFIERTEYAQYTRPGVRGGDSVAPELGQTVSPTVSESPALTAAKSKLGKLLERFGLSTTGDVPGTLEAVYADEFAQNANKILGEKYGATIKIGNKTLPIDKLYSFLDKNKNDIMQAKWSSGIHYTVADLSVDSLTRLGVDRAVATDIVKVARQSLADMPWSKTGLTEGLVNYMRAKSNLYNGFYKLKNHIHFNLSPSFAARKQFKNNVLAMMANKSFGFDFGERINSMIRQQISRVPYLRDVPYFEKILSPDVNLSEVKLMNDEVLSNVTKDVFDYGSNPEIAQIATDFFGGETLNKSARFARSIQDRNVFNRYIGYNVQSHATAFAKGFAEKYGMSLEDALGYHYVNGTKVYNNPTMVNLIKDNVQAIFHYKSGILTSPLMRTINTIWFPTRFETKVAMRTAEWFGSLSPAARMVTVDSWIHFVNFKNSPEGQAWLKANKSKLEGLLDYLLPYGDMSKSISSFASGRLFNGETGMLGGLPLGFFVNVLQDLAIVPEGQATNPVTGKPVMKEVPKKILSEASAITVLEDLATFILPAMPNYSLLGGTVTPFSQVVKENVKGAVSTATPGGTSKQNLKKLNRQYRSVPSGYSRFFNKK